jgi:V8-like Glu-specific endopeptidase
VVNHRIARIREAGRVSDGQALHIIGHPTGLPAKFAGGGTVRDNHNRAFFVENMDAYAGNSGSPVFNSTTHIVEGVHVRGKERQFVRQGECFVSRSCPETGCRGGDTTRTTEFVRFITWLNRGATAR